MRGLSCMLKAVLTALVFLWRSRESRGSSAAPQQSGSWWGPFYWACRGEAHTPVLLLCTKHTFIPTGWWNQPHTHTHTVEAHTPVLLLWTKHTFIPTGWWNQPHTHTEERLTHQCCCSALNTLLYQQADDLRFHWMINLQLDYLLLLSGNSRQYHLWLILLRKHLQTAFQANICKVKQKEACVHSTYTHTHTHTLIRHSDVLLC